MNVPNADVRGMEKCGSCKKLVYLHQPTVVCCLDGHIDHGSCLGYDIDTCNHIRNTPDWFCNSCMGTCLPFFNNFLNDEPKDKITCLCEFCKSDRRDLNEIFNRFDIFNGDENINEFDDSMCDTLSLASNVLSNCSYKNVNEIVNADESYATLYFQNIDGYKSNFEETMYNINSLRSSPSLLRFVKRTLKKVTLITMKYPGIIQNIYMA